MPYLAQLGYAFARVGERDGAREILERLIDLSKERYISSYAIAAIYSALDDKNAAFDWLKRAYNERTPRLIELPDPAFAGLESDPRFAELLMRVRTSL